ncbi:alkaline phosphatase [Mucilaginibacter sp. JRF]|uniref:alkaline phosphatase n=1 Tax=Mucilaginibacter sp. JRF TaxID=2780088 RepID=UPI00187EF499|nr:alkaline phosphatase [Mucilaginibacter sp. JRF]MBE9586457.1 alkaline phosphatase [Mucilaginibacter sp. JRF]
MKRIFSVLAIIALGSTQLLAQKKNSKPLFDHVIVIGIDGLSSAGLMKANAPVLHKMIEEGAFKYNARTVLPSSSSSNWSAMILGAGPEITGVTSNDWKPNAKHMTPVAVNKVGRSPSIYDIIRQQRPNAEQGVVFHWDDYGRLLQKEMVNHYEYAETETKAAEKFAEYITAKKPTFALLHLDHVDHAGHEKGHMTDDYLQSIAKADSLIGSVLKAIDAAGMKENTLVMIVADHGGINKGHGGESDEEINIPVIYYGKGVKKGYKIQQPVYQYDVAATVAFVFNLKVPYSWTSRPVKAAFTGFSEPENLMVGLE